MLFSGTAQITKTRQREPGFFLQVWVHHVLLDNGEKQMVQTLATAVCQRIEAYFLCLFACDFWGLLDLTVNLNLTVDRKKHEFQEIAK